MSNKISGVVEGVGEKFNGSLKVNGSWLNYKKGTKNVAKVGDKVTLTLEPWEFNGKSGQNITAVDVLAVSPENMPAKAPEAKPKYDAKLDRHGIEKAPIAFTGRDFDKEARGKTFCSYLTALLGNAALVNSSDVELDALYVLAQKATDRTFNE